MQNEVEASKINKILSKNKVNLQSAFGDSKTYVLEMQDIEYAKDKNATFELAPTDLKTITL